MHKHGDVNRRVLSASKVYSSKTEPLVPNEKTQSKNILYKFNWLLYNEITFIVNTLIKCTQVILQIIKDLNLKMVSKGNTFFGLIKILKREQTNINHSSSSYP